MHKSPDKTEQHSFTSITTDSNSLLEQYHIQMPVILKPSEYARWLSGDRIPIDPLRPFDTEAMTAICVDLETAVTEKDANLFDSL
jgi:putative SOS response-associated peptidase YedK